MPAPGLIFSLPLHLFVIKSQYKTYTYTHPWHLQILSILQCGPPEWRRSRKLVKCWPLSAVNLGPNALSVRRASLETHITNTHAHTHAHTFDVRVYNTLNCEPLVWAFQTEYQSLFHILLVLYLHSLCFLLRGETYHLPICLLILNRRNS